MFVQGLKQWPELSFRGPEAARNPGTRRQKKGAETWQLLLASERSWVPGSCQGKPRNDTRIRVQIAQKQQGGHPAATILIAEKAADMIKSSGG